MRLSIITVNYNNLQGLIRTFESVASQSCFKQVEHIVIDAASSDGSVDVISEYESKMAASALCCRWISEKDGGIYDGMNKGILMAEGDYLYFLNSGDTFVNNHVLAELLCNLPDSDVIVGRINFVDANGTYHPGFQKRMPCVSLMNFIQAGIPHQAALIKRDLFLKYGLYNLKYRIVADWEFFLRALIINQSSIAYSDILIANFDNNGITSRHVDKMMQEIDLVLKDSLPMGILTDYEWFRNNAADVSRLKWLQGHAYVHKLVTFIVRIGRIL